MRSASRTTRIFVNLGTSLLCSLLIALGGSFDAAGNLYVVTGAEISRASTAILEFAAGANGNVAPIREITGSSTMISGSYVSNPVLDTNGNIYVMAFRARLEPEHTAICPGCERQRAALSREPKRRDDQLVCHCLALEAVMKLSPV